MSKRINVTIQDLEMVWLQRKAERYGVPLVSIVPRVLAEMRLAEEDNPAAVPRSSSTVAGAMQTHDGSPDIRDEVAQAIAGVSWLELTSADHKH